MNLKPGATGAAGAALSMVLAVSLTGCGAAEGSSASARTVTVSYSEEVADELPLWIASEAGYFKEQGLDVKLVSLASEQGYPSLVSGQTQIASMGGSQIVAGAAAGGDVKELAALTPVFPYELYANVDSAADLKGKRVGYTSKSGSQYIGTVAALKKVGLGPDDVNLVPLGSVTNVNNALLAGTIDAAATHPPTSLKFDDAGLHKVLDLAKEELANVNVGISARSSYIKEHPGVLEKFMAALKKGFERERSDKEYATRILGRHIAVDDQRALDATWDYYTSEALPDYPEVTPEQLTAARDSLGSAAAGVDKLDLSSLIDSTFVEKVWKGK